MRVLYHLTVPPSPLAACDAVVQEVEALRRPVVYTAVAGAQRVDRKTVQALADRVHALVVPTDSDCDRLRDSGISIVVTIRPGIDTERFYRTPPPPMGGLFGGAGRR